jgi:hypothetical protein
LWGIVGRLLSTRLPTLPLRNLNAAQCQAVKDLARPGDILLDSNYSFLLPQIGNKLFFGSTWIHAAIYIGDGMLIDSGRRAHVAHLPLDKFLQTTGLAIYRPVYQSPADVAAMIQYAKECLGLPFNVSFDQNDPDALYCGQLVARALESMPHPITIEPRQVFGRKLLPPAAIAACPDIKCIWTSQPRFLTNIGAHWPLLAASMLGSSCGHAIGLAPLAGGTLGIIALAVLANSIRPHNRDH